MAELGIALPEQIHKQGLAQAWFRPTASPSFPLRNRRAFAASRAALNLRPANLGQMLRFFCNVAARLPTVHGRRSDLFQSAWSRRRMSMPRS